MKVPNFKRIFKTDYEKQYQKLIETLSFSLNNAIDVINNAINGNISLSENILCSIKDLTLQVDANGTPTSPITFPVNFTGQVQGLLALNVTNKTNSNSYPTSGVFVSFEQTQNGILIKNITGLVAGNSYTLRIVAFG